MSSRIRYKSNDNSHKSRENYIESLYFTLQYYYIGCPSWSWHYQFRIAPLLGDVYHYLDENSNKNINSAMEKGFKVIKLDLYGRGFSDNPNVDYTDELFAKQVIELLLELEISTATFLGLSNGGRVISKIADLKPNMVENLVYVSASSFNNHENLENKDVSMDEINNFIENRYPTISSGQLSDFKYPENYPDWDDKYEELLKFDGFARALISTLKNHVNLDSENKEISDSNKTVYTIWGDSDSVVVYNQIKDKLNKLLPNRFEYIVPNSGHLPHIENQVDFEKYLFEVVLK